MKVAEIPSLVLLPGLITLVAAAALRARLFQWRLKTEQGEPDWKSPGFWIIAVTLSGLICWAALRFLKIDFSDSYGLEQVVILWLLSLTLFPMIYLLSGWILNPAPQRRFALAAAQAARPIPR